MHSLVDVGRSAIGDQRSIDEKKRRWGDDKQSIPWRHEARSKASSALEHNSRSLGDFMCPITYNDNIVALHVAFSLVYYIRIMSSRFVVTDALPGPETVPQTLKYLVGAGLGADTERRTQMLRLQILSTASKFCNRRRQSTVPGRLFVVDRNRVRVRRNYGQRRKL